VLISTLHRIEREAYFEPSAKNLFEGAMAGMANVLSEEFGDGYSQYIPPSRMSNYRDRIDNRYEGIGISVRLYTEEGENKFFIDYPQHGSPAYRAGLRSGDQILQIDDIPLAGKTHSEVIRLLRRQTESEIRLSVLPFGQAEPKGFFVRREKIQFDSVLGGYFESDSRTFCLEAHPKIGYVWITSFGGPTVKEFGDALDRMMQSGAEAFILDLRDNGGGDVWSCVQIAKMLLAPETEKVVTMMRERNRIRSWLLSFIEETQRCTLPMVVLINDETASASEILAAALQDHQRATIVGTRSYGKGIIQGYFDLPFQSGILKLTDSEFLRPSGAPIHRKKDATDSDGWGVIPDRVVEISETTRSAEMIYRVLRTNVISDQRLAVLEQFRQQIVESEKEASEQERFEFSGAAPYYDPQLDEAIKILLAETDAKD